MRWLLGIAFVLIMLLAGARALYVRAGPLPHAQAIVVPRGPVSLAAASLQQDGALPPGPGASVVFRLAARLTRTNGPIRAGEFAFPAHASLRAMLRVLRTSPPVQHDLTIPEGLTAAQIAQRIAQAQALSGPTPVPAEGSILPQTYDFVRGTARAALVARMQQAMTRRVDAIWASRDPKAGLSNPDEMMILASMVERETARPAERPLVARVFLNRLRLGMKLQSDPTVIYAAAGGLGPLPRPLSRADLALDNPYNTYVVAGLPAGPICAPGVAALAAVAHPAASDALYFVADGSGGHRFSSSLPEHIRNVAHWRAAAAP